ncbi:MAG: hypothetical protein PHG23_01740 [Candidatus Pacebacteria bacterium]|nr:hypothetical protein [Candidatus Paceibacterota bacterium]
MDETSRTAIVVDFERTITSPFAREAIKKCCEKYGVSPQTLVSVINFPWVKPSISGDVLQGCNNIFREAIKNAEPDLSALDALMCAYNAGCDIYISSKGFYDAIEESLKKTSFTQLHVSIVFGREDGTKQEHLEKIKRIGEYDKIIVIGNDVADLNGIAADIKIAVNAVREDFSETKVDALSEGPLMQEILEPFLN